MTGIDSPVLEMWHRVKNRGRVLAIFAICVLIVSLALNLFILPRIYRGTAIIVPMTTPQGSATVTPDAVKTELLDPSFAIPLTQKMGGELTVSAYLNGLQVETFSGTGMVWVSFEHRDMETIRTVLDALVPVLNQAHDEQYKTALRGYEEALTALDERLDAVRAEEAEIQHSISTSQGSAQDKALTYLLAQNCYDALLEMDTQLTMQRNNIITQYRSAHAFQYISVPNTLERPVRPRKLLNTVMAVLVALMVGVVWAYLDGGRPRDLSAGRRDSA